MAEADAQLQMSFQSSSSTGVRRKDDHSVSALESCTTCITRRPCGDTEAHELNLNIVCFTCLRFAHCVSLQTGFNDTSLEENRGLTPQPFHQVQELFDKHESITIIAKQSHSTNKVHSLECTNVRFLVIILSWRGAARLKHALHHLKFDSSDGLPICDGKVGQ